MTAPKALPRWAPFPYFGGKRYYALQICSHLPAPRPQLVHLEPFAGGFAVGITKQPWGFVIGDANAELAAFWYSICFLPERLQERIALTINYDYTPEHLRDAVADADAALALAESMGEPEAKLRAARDEIRVLKGVAFLFQICSSFGGIPRHERVHKANLGRYANPHHDLTPWVRALARNYCRVWDTDFRATFRTIADNDWRENAYYAYADPPYHGITGMYAQDMADDDFRDLVKCLTEFEAVGQAKAGEPALWVLSINDDAFVRDLLSPFHVKEVSFQYALKLRTEQHELLVSNQPFAVRDPAAAQAAAKVAADPEWPGGSVGALDGFL